MTQIVPDGGARTSEDLYIGVPNELRVDQSNQEIRVHDGATAGGKRIPNLDTNDSRYQSRNGELDGLSFDPNAKGFLSRIGNGIYRLRKFITDDNIVVLNPDGVNGNPTLALADTLIGDRTIDGQFKVTGTAEFDAGINGDLAGDTTGTHTGPTLGDGDFRGHTINFDDGQIPQSAVAGLAAALAAALVPQGSIVGWSGTIEAIPTHWKLCDGNNGTPDLRNTFIMGVGADIDINGTGGTATHTHVATADAGGEHSHNITVDAFQLLAAHMPSHSHSNGILDNNSPSDVFNRTQVPANPTTNSGVASINDLNSSSHPIGVVEGTTSTTGGDAAHAHGASSDSQGNHTHNVSVTPASSLPPYYGLAFIMKTA